MKNVSPKISIIIPAYKTEKFIGKCLESVVNQDFTLPYEVIVVNDGSPDNLMDIVSVYSDKYNFIKVISKDNGGVSSARNAGVYAAEGEFIAFVDSDDFIQPNFLSAMYDAAKQTKADIVCCNFYNTFPDGSHSVKCVLKHSAGVYDAKHMLKSILYDVTLRSYLWNKLFRRSLFIDNRLTFPLGVKFEDVVIMPQLFHYAHTVTVIKEYLYNYVRHSGSITSSLKKADVKDYIESYTAIRTFLERENIFSCNRFCCYILSKKVSVTVLGMLIRCWIKDRKGTYVLDNYKRARIVLKLYSSDKYYYADEKLLNIVFK